MLEKNNKKIKVICILGMHRSGTSMLARILNICGVYLGEQGDIMPSVFGNEKGHWENLEFVTINEEILKRFGGSWELPPRFQTGWETSLDLVDIREKAELLVSKMSERSRVWGFKDPRTCLTLPFWRRVIPDMYCIASFRDPMEVAMSLKRRSSIPIEGGLLLWKDYWVSLINSSESMRRLFTEQKGYLNDWRGELSRVVSFINDPDVTWIGKEKEIETFISPELDHHKNDERNTDTNLDKNEYPPFLLDSLGHIIDKMYQMISSKEKEELIARLMETVDKQCHELEFIKSSKFWKIRNIYVKYKNKIPFLFSKPRKIIKK